MDLPSRSSPAKQAWLNVVNRPNIVFVTLCTKGRKQVLDRPEVHDWLVQVWSDDWNQWLVGRYVLMPDHIHLFAAPKAFDSPNVRQWITWWKKLATRGWPYPDDKPLWQRAAWDRQLRCGESYEEKWRYVANNPVRHGLVEQAKYWPYQGSLHPLAWHR